MKYKDDTKVKLPYMLALCLAILFAIDAALILTGHTSLLDKTFFGWVVAHRSDLLTRIIVPITYMGNWQTVSTIGLALLLIPSTSKKIGVPTVTASVFSTIIYKALKHCFTRPRPPVELRLIKQGGFSFPSGHSMNCIVCYGILIYLIRKHCPNKAIANLLTVLLTILIISIGSSRVYVGVHYPTDVLGGWLAGLTFLVIVIQILERINKERP